MNVIIVGTAFPYISEFANFNDRLADEFVAEGHNVEIVTFSLQYPTLFFPGRKKISGSESREGHKIVRMINSVDPTNWSKVAKYIISKKPDLVIFTYESSYIGVCMGAISRRVGKVKTIKRLAIVKDMIPDDAAFYDRILPLSFVRNVDGFVTMSNETVDEINYFDKKNKPKIAVCHPLYDHYGSILQREEALQELSLSPDYRYILFFGYIRPYKGLDLLIDAFADERLRKYNVKLIVAGEFKTNPRPYIDKIKSSKLDDCLEMRTTFIHNSDVNKYFSACDIFVQPYKSLTRSAVTQVAYNFAKPMLVTDVGNLRETVHDGVVGYVVKPEKNKIADALVDFFENNRREQFEKNVEIEKQKFSWGNLTHTVETLL